MLHGGWSTSCISIGKYESPSSHYIKQVTQAYSQIHTVADMAVCSSKMASDPLSFNLHDQLEPLECNSRQTRRGSASPQSAHTSSYYYFYLFIYFIYCFNPALWLPHSLINDSGQNHFSCLSTLIKTRSSVENTMFIVYANC